MRVAPILWSACSLLPPGEANWVITLGPKGVMTPDRRSPGQALDADLVNCFHGAALGKPPTARVAGAPGGTLRLHRCCGLLAADVAAVVGYAGVELPSPSGRERQGWSEDSCAVSGFQVYGRGFAQASHSGGRAFSRSPQYQARSQRRRGCRHGNCRLQKGGGIKKVAE